MAYGIISRPGTEYGPCAEPCAHLDCASLRFKAETICRYCGKAVGYETKFCIEDVNLAVHWLCAVKDAEKNSPAHDPALTENDAPYSND